MSTGYFVYGVLLVIVFLGIVLYLYNPKMKHRHEAPKYRILDDNDAQPGSDSKD